MIFYIVYTDSVGNTTPFPKIGNLYITTGLAVHFQQETTYILIICILYG